MSIANRYWTYVPLFHWYVERRLPRSTVFSNWFRKIGFGGIELAFSCVVDYTQLAALYFRDEEVLILNFFYPIALIYLVFALRRVYRQKWAMTVLKAVVLFACETLLFVTVNIGGS